MGTGTKMSSLYQNVVQTPRAAVQQKKKKKLNTKKRERFCNAIPPAPPSQLQH